MPDSDADSAGKSILDGVDELIDSAFDLNEIGKAPHYKHETSCREFTKAAMKGLGASALVEEIYEKIIRNWHGSKSRGKDNWRWEQNTESKKEEENGSKEVILERLIVRTMGKEWVNQVPTSSGLTKVTKPRQSFDKRRAVDLVHRCGNGQYEMIELKVDQKAGPPLFAAMEILQYGLLYAFYRDNLQVLEPDKLKPEKEELFGATGIHLKVLAPEPYYKNRKGEDHKLEPLEGMINDGLEAFLADRKFGFKMDFKFQKFHRSFALDSVVTDRKSRDQRIVEALNQREPVYSQCL